MRREGVDEVVSSRTNDTPPGWSIKCSRKFDWIEPVLIFGGSDLTHHNLKDDGT